MRLAVVVLVLLWFAAPAAAGWAPARVLGSNSGPRAAAERSDGGVVLLAGDGVAASFSWAPSSLGPMRAVLADRSPNVDSEQRWAINRRGDALLVRWLDSDRVSVLAIDAGGRRSAMRIDVGSEQSIDEVRAVVAADGTGAIAWTQSDHVHVTPRSSLSIRVRPAGASFGPVLELPAPGPVVMFALSAADDGRIEAAFAGQAGGEQVIRYAELAPMAPPVVENVATTTEEPSVYPVIDVSLGRVLTRLPTDQLGAAVRTWTGNWSAPQTIAAGVRTARIAALPDGGALLAYARDRDVFVARAPPAAPFGPSVRIARAARRWAVDAIELSVSPGGNALLAWHESIDFRVCASGCVSRVMAASAPPNGPFGQPERVSSLGSVAGFPIEPIAAISSRGESVIAWSEDVSHLVAARGDSRPSPPAGPPDRKRPRVRATTTLARLRAAEHGAPLRVRVSCDEPCAVTVTMWNPRVFWSVYDLDPVAFNHAATKLAHWRLSADQRRELRGLLRAGRPTLDALATDASGNLSTTQKHVNDL